MFQFLCRFAFY